MSRLRACIALLAALTLAPAWLDGVRALAQADDAIAAGRQEYEAAQSEFNLGHYESALSHFERSYRLTGKSALLYNIGFVDKRLYERTRKIEHLRDAVDRIKAYLASTPAADPVAATQRARAEKELRQAEEWLIAEESARAKGEAGLQLGEELLAKGRTDEAEAQLERFEKTPGNERAGVVRACVLRAAVAASRAQEAAAVQAWSCALALDRQVAPAAGASEGARRAYAAAVDAMHGAPVLAVNHTPPASLALNVPVELVFVAASDPTSMIRGVKLHYRAGGGAFSSLPLARLGKITLPRAFTAGLLPGARLEYYAEVVDGNDAVLEHLGVAELPFAVKVESPPRRVATWKWLAPVGVALAAGAVGIGLGVHYSQPPPRTQVPIDFGLTGAFPLTNPF